MCNTCMHTRPAELARACSVHGLGWVGIHVAICDAEGDIAHGSKTALSKREHSGSTEVWGMPTVTIYHLGRPHVSLRPKDKSHHLI